MLYELFVHEKTNEARREAEKVHLINMIKTSIEDQTKPFLTVILCRVGLISACSSMISIQTQNIG